MIIDSARRLAFAAGCLTAILTLPTAQAQMGGTVPGSYGASPYPYGYGPPPGPYGYGSSQGTYAQVSVSFTAMACLAVCSWLVRWKRALSVLRFRSRARWSVQYCENSSASRGNVFRGRKQSKEHDYISEFTLTNRPKSVCRFCEDIANVRHLFMVLPLRWG